MDYQTILENDFKLIKNKRIGRVIYVVEGNKTEINLLKKIYNEVLGYNYISKNRAGYEMKFVSDKDKYSVIYVFNSKNSNISSIDNSSEINDEITNFIRDNYDEDFSIDNAAIFYLFDRDYKSNNNEMVYHLINQYGNSREPINDYDRQGLLLLSYPAIESYLAESLHKRYFKHDFGLGYKLKRYIKNRKIDIKDINEQTLVTSSRRMHRMLYEMEILNYNIDDFSKTNKDVFNYQENYLLRSKKGYKLISMLSLSLIDLGILKPVKRKVKNEEIENGIGTRN